ncbi:MAG: AAA-like domain-containing protein [Lachnospiraceae bacterium]|nr:AAA-like domain-containing protein [Lachnospiraceae bacterium]
MKKFNTTGLCVPSKHYMVDLSEKVALIKKMVDDGEYFTINRARQYGKTTTLYILENYLQQDYHVLSLDFQKLSGASFRTEESFVKAFCRAVLQRKEKAKIPEQIVQELYGYIGRADQEAVLDELFFTLSTWCKTTDKPVVMMIDEVDSATNNQVFLDFLSQLRGAYLDREKDPEDKTFQSVILAGVTDIKHLKSKIRDESEAKENSPWNISADFTIDMSLSESGILKMLEEYEADHQTGMETGFIARKIREYTNGYPFLVSRICQLLDERLVPDPFNALSDAWTDNGVEEAVKSIIVEKNTLFDSLMGKVRDYDELRNQLKQILFKGETVAYIPYNKEQEQLLMYGFLVKNHNTIAVANRIFEMLLYNHFIGESRFTEELRGDALDNKPEFIKGGELDIPLIMERFIRTQEHIRNLNDEEAEKRFIEDEGREKFLTYISPIINGVGTFSVEDRNRDRRRMDVVIHYRGKRYIIELKIWNGDRYNAQGEKQILDYLDSYGLKTGYMLSFSFNKTKNTVVEEVHIGDKTIFEGIV